MKWYKIIGLFVISFIFLVGCATNQSNEGTKTKETISKEPVTTNPLPAIYQTAKEQAKALEAFPVLYKSAIEAHKNETDFGMYVIPGLLETISLANDTSRTPSICDSMTPQGVTATDDFLLISSYCNDHEHNSVIYVLDKESREYKKTIVLQGQPHVGGITYDPIAENIWVCSRYDDRAEIVAFPLEQLEVYDFEADHEPIEYTQQVELPQLSRASVITYHDRTIYVGYFDPQQEGRLEAYPLDENGQATGQPAFEHKIQTTIDLDKSDDGDEVVRELQGITFYKNKMLITQSYGAMSDSKLLIFDYNKQQTEFLDEQVNKMIELPAHAEQLSEKDGQIYLIFESAAKPYRLVEKTWVDRVLKLDFQKIID